VTSRDPLVAAIVEDLEIFQGALVLGQNDDLDAESMQPLDYIGVDGKTRTLRQGSGQWTRMPGHADPATPDPMCGDKNAMEWAAALGWPTKNPSQTKSGSCICFAGTAGRATRIRMQPRKNPATIDAGGDRRRDLPGRPPDSEIYLIPKIGGALVFRNPSPHHPPNKLLNFG
jgi:hypothetical protein